MKKQPMNKHKEKKKSIDTCISELTFFSKFLLVFTYALCLITSLALLLIHTGADSEYFAELLICEKENITSILMTMILGTVISLIVEYAKRHDISIR